MKRKQSETIADPDECNSEAPNRREVCLQMTVVRGPKSNPYYP